MHIYIVSDMKNRLFLFIFADCLLLHVIFVRVNSYRVAEHDLDICSQPIAYL